jgi:N-dimethylarginine dimethylaminohydrolase
VNRYEHNKLIHVEKRISLDSNKITGTNQITGANIVKAGKDVYFDLLNEFENEQSKEKIVQQFKHNIQPYFKNFRCHLLFNGGHIDACFSILKPGLILASSHFSEYHKTFPDWEIILLDRPEFQNFDKPNSFHGEKNWYIPNDKKNNSFHEHIINYAFDWVGNFTETYFDINCLIVDEKNILMLGENENLYKLLAKKGINVHTVPFRTRTFWDGGLHCLTVDILRDCMLQDYFNFQDDLIVY